MKRKQFIKNLFFAGLFVPLATACGDTGNTPAGSNSATATLGGPTTGATSANPTATTKPANTSVASPIPVANQQAGNNKEPIVLHFSEFYAPGSPATDPVLSDKLKAAAGKRIKITGYMAPPLKPALDFFVLTRIKLMVCPFCSTSAEWPQDIMLVTMPNGKTVEQIEDPITITGRLEVGDAVDPQTGFFSLLRLRAENVEIFVGS